MQIFKISSTFLLFVILGFATISNLNAGPIADEAAQIELISEQPTATRLFVNFNSFIAEKVPTSKEELKSATLSRWVLIPPDCGVEARLNHQKTSNYELRDGSEYENLLPSDFVWTGEPAIMRGYRLLPIFVSPIRLNPKTGNIERLESGEIELDFTSPLNRINLVQDPLRPRPSRYIHRILSQMVVNPPPRRDEDMIGGSIAYVIPNYNDVNNTLTPLVEWRRRMGWKVEVIRIAQNTDRFVILNALQQAYNNWEFPPEFVVLVGDAPGMMGNNRTLAYFDMRDGAQYAYESDQPFALLEGNDFLPEVAIGRITFDNINMLSTQVNKIIQYESSPYIGTQGNYINWQLKAAVAATDSRSGRSSIDVCKWFGELVRQNGFTNVYELYFTAQNPQIDPTNFLSTYINAGVSFVLYRGWSDMNDFSVRDIQRRINNGARLPFIMLATCNTGEYVLGSQESAYGYSERFVNLSIGAIGAVGASGATHSAYNNMIASGTLRAPFVDKIYAQGWALQMGKIALIKAYQGRGDINHEENRNMEAWLTEYYIFNLMGDPAVELYTAVPCSLTVIRPAQLRAGETHYSVEVRYANNNSPVVDANVCLYKSQSFQVMQKTDHNGRVDFTLLPTWTQPGQVKLTVSGPNLIPYMADFNITQVQNMLGFQQVSINDDNEGLSSGNNNGEADATEDLELEIQIFNYGQQRPNGNMTVVLKSDSPLLTVLEDTLRFESAPAPGNAQIAVFPVLVDGGCPNGMVAKFYLEVLTEGGASFINAFTIPIYAPQLEVESIEWAGEPIRLGEASSLSIRLTNIGEGDSPPTQAELISLTSTVIVQSSHTTFDAIAVGERALSERGLRIFASNMHIAGNPAQLALILQADNGFRDTAFFNITVGESQPNQPFGPDNYGYICIDDIDSTWQNRPIFNWIELNPRLGGRGTNTGLVDLDEEHDTSCVVRLPFNFRYYGTDFTTLTICTNGWAAFGNHSSLIGGRNRHIPGGEVVSAMLCPFWDDLLTTENNGIFYAYDENNGIFIVEWSEMRKLGPNGNGEPLETFEIILYDPSVHRTTSGDGEIVFQYLEVSDSPSCFQSWDTPFATVGIGSPDQRDGLEYTYWSSLHPGAAGLMNHRAIKFTTEKSFAVGALRGRVFDAMNDEPLSGAQVRLSLGNQTTTDENGEYIFLNLPPNRDISISVSYPFFNDSTRSAIEIMPYDTVEVHFGLLKPLFSLDRQSYEIRLSSDQSTTDSVLVYNTGTGTLIYNAQLSTPDIEWFAFSPTTDTIRAGDSLFIRLIFHPENLTEGDYLTDIVFLLNARPGSAVLPIRLSVVLSAEDKTAPIPTTLNLFQNYPNPFNARTTVVYSLPMSGEVRFFIMDISGRTQALVYNGYKPAGWHRLEFGLPNLPAGIYIGRLEVEGNCKIIKMLLMK